MNLFDIFENKDMCKVCGQTPCNCTSIDEGVAEASFDYTTKDLGNDYAGFASNHSMKHKFLAKIKPEKQQLYKDKMNNMHDWDSLFQLFKVATARGDIIEQGVAEGAPIVVMPSPERLKKAEPKKVDLSKIGTPAKPPSTEKRGVKGRPGQRPMPQYEQGVAENFDAQAAASKEAEIGRLKAQLKNPNNSFDDHYKITRQIQKLIGMHTDDSVLGKDVAEGWKDKVAGGALALGALGGLGALQNAAPNVTVQGHQMQLANPGTQPDDAKLVTTDDGKKVYAWKTIGHKNRSQWVYRPVEQVKEQGLAEAGYPEVDHMPGKRGIGLDSTKPKDTYVATFHASKEKEAQEFAKKHGHIVKKHVYPKSANNSQPHEFQVHKNEQGVAEGSEPMTLKGVMRERDIPRGEWTKLVKQHFGDKVKIVVDNRGDGGPSAWVAISSKTKFGQSGAPLCTLVLDQSVAEGLNDFKARLEKRRATLTPAQKAASEKIMKKTANGRGISNKELDDFRATQNKAQGVAEGVDIGQEWMSDTELDQYVPKRLQQQWRELLGYDENGNPSALWANLTGGYEPDVNDPQHRRLMVKVANKWFAAKKIPNVKFFDVKDADDELEWLVQIGQQGVAEETSNAPTKYRATVEYGPTAADAHFVTVTANSTEEAEAKVQKWCEKKGVRNPMITINGADKPIGEGDVVAFPKKHKGDLASVNDCPKCGGDLQGGKYMGHEVKVCMPCKQVYLPPNSGIDQKGNKIDEGSQFERKITRTQALIQDYYNRARASSNDIKRDHYIDMARQLEYELEGMINDANQAEQDSYEIAQHDATPSATWNRGGLEEQGVAEGLKDTIYPNAEVIKSKNGKPLGEIYQDGSGWGCFHYKADNGADSIESREQALEWLKDLHDEYRQDQRLREDREDTLKNYIRTSAGDAINRQNIANRTGTLDPRIAKRNAGQLSAQNKLSALQAAMSGPRGSKAAPTADKHPAQVLDEAISSLEMAELLYAELDKRFPDLVKRYGHEVVGDAIMDVAEANDDQAMEESDVARLVDDVIAKLEQYVGDREIEEPEVVDEFIDPEMEKEMNYASRHYAGYDKEQAFKKLLQRGIKHSKDTDREHDAELAQLAQDVAALKQKVGISETRMYYNIVGTSDNELRTKFGMRKDPNGWFIAEGASKKTILEAFRAFGDPKAII